MPTQPNSDDTEDDTDEDDTICREIRICQYYQRVLHVTFNSGNFRYDCVEEDLSFPSANSQVTLRELLDRRVFSTVGGDNINVYSWHDRYLLGLNLARSLFYLFDGPWGSSDWRTDEIIFLASQEADLAMIYGRHRPYIRSRLSIEAESSQDQRNTTARQLCYPMWLALAQVLMEVQIGRSLWTVNDATLNDLDLRKELLRLAKDELKDAENVTYREAIENCLNFGFKLHRMRGQRRQREERRLIWNEIVCKLEENYQKWSTERLEIMDLRVPSERPTETTERFVEPHLQNELTPSPLHPTGQAEGFPVRNVHKEASRPRTRLMPGISILTLFDDTDSNDVSMIDSCQKFFDKVAKFNLQYIEPLKAIQKSSKIRNKIRIAVLDSGVDSQNDPFIRGALSKGRIRGGWGPTGATKDHFQDTYGHGTHVSRLLLKTAPLAEIYVAKISEEKTLDESRVQDIVDAINWAVKTVDAHIITMSFGMRKPVEEVTRAINRALKRSKLVFAAAANEGALQPRAYPASLPGVICIHATDGYGTPATFNPNAEVGDNFSTAGVGIMSEWATKPVFKSGTSFATPIAAGIAASILDFARTHLTKELDRPEFLYSYRGMRHLLKSMAPERIKYHFISPWNAFRELEVNDQAGLQNGWEEVSEELRGFILTGTVPKHWGNG